MWPRVVEIMLGLWLIASPYFFGIPDSAAIYFFYGLSVMIFGFLSFWRRTGRVYLLTLALAIWLIVSAYLEGYPTPPATQNRLVVGLLLAMFAIIPSRTNEIPPAWREYYRGQDHN